MPFKKGKSGNPSGRRPNTPNKTSDQLRALLTSFIEANINDLQANYNQLEPKEKLICFERLIKMVLPPLLNNELERLSEQDLDLLILKLKRDAKQ
jgi:hypothetical protein